MAELLQKVRDKLSEHAVVLVYRTQREIGVCEYGSLRAVRILQDDSHKVLGVYNYKAPDAWIVDDLEYCGVKRND